MSQNFKVYTMANPITYLCSVVALAALVSGQGQDLKFQSFLTAAMQNYSSWVTSKGIDPSPPSKDTVLIERSGVIFKGHGYITNQSLGGHSLLYNVSIESSYTSRRILLALESNFRVHGEYLLNGTAFPESSLATPVSGVGNFTITNEGARMTIGVDMIDFTVASDHIDLSQARITYNATKIGVAGYVADYEGLDAGLYKDEVIVDLRGIYESQLRSWLPQIDYLTAYLAKVFADNPVSQIVG